MKETWKNIADNNSKTGRGRKHWEYFETFKDLSADCATVTLDNVCRLMWMKMKEDERCLDDRPLAQRTPVAALSAGNFRRLFVYELARHLATTVSQLAVGAIISSD